MDMHDVSVGKVKKLVPNLYDKKRYVFYYKKFAIVFGIRIELKNIAFNAEKKIHRIRKEIVYITQLKIYSLSIQGKTITNTRNRVAKICNE